MSVNQRTASSDEPSDPRSSATLALPFAQHLQLNQDEKATFVEEDWETDPANPYNWPNRKKWLVCLTVSVTGFMSTAGSSMPAPSAAHIGAHLGGSGSSDAKVQTLLTAMYVLGLGFGPFIFSPVAELYGRQSAYITSTLPFALFNASCLLAPNMAAMVCLRFFAGFFGSSGPALGVATVSDVFNPRERGTPISIYAIGPMAGPVLGSLLGGWLSLVHWRWTFVVLSIISTINGLAQVLFMSETYEPVIKYRKAYLQRVPVKKDVGKGATSWETKFGRWGWVIGLAKERDWKMVFTKAITRPFRFLFLNPVLAVFALYYSFVYAAIYLQVVCLPLLFSKHSSLLPHLFNYEWSPAVFPLCYIGLGLGFFASATTAANAQNRIYAYLCKKNGGEGQPEYRLVLCQMGMIFFPIGWLIFGWTAQSHTHWIGPLIGMVIGAYGLMLSFNSLQNFTVDWCSPYSAAGVAAITFVRSIVACLLPIFGKDMFDRLGWGLGGTLMAALSLCALPAPLIMFVYGKQLRERWKIVG